MANKICRLNGTYEFPFDFMAERASYNESTRSYEPVLRFQVSLSEINNFVIDLIPYMGITITSIEIIDTQTQQTFTMPSAYDTIVDVSTNFPQAGENSGQVIFTNNVYATKPAQEIVIPDTEPRIE